MPSNLHEQLNVLGAAWLRRRGFSVVSTNVFAAGSKERMDVIGFRQTCCVIIESKVSRQDFFADQKKPHRHNNGVGNYRFYLTPMSLVTVDELPNQWGLLEAKGQRVLETVVPEGNYWPRDNPQDNNWSRFHHHSEMEVERHILFSLARKGTKS